MMPLGGRKQDTTYPEEMSYDVFMTQILAPNSENGQANFCFGNEEKEFGQTNFTPSVNLLPNKIDGTPRKMHIWYQQSDVFMLSIQLFDEKDK